MTQRHDNSKHDFLRSTLVALAEVMLVSLALGMAVGFGVAPLVAVLAATLVGTASTSVILLRRKALQMDGQRDADKQPTPAPSDESAQVAEPSANQGPRFVAAPEGQPSEADLSMVPAESGPVSLEPKPPHSRLDLEALSSRIVGVPDPITELKLFVGDIRTREAEGTDPAPSPFERFAARILCEAGLFSRRSTFSKRQYFGCLSCRNR